MSGSGRERGGHSVSRGPAGQTRTPRHLMSLRSQSACDGAWLTAVRSARRQALTLRWPDTTISIHWMTMKFHRSSRGTDNFDETTTALVSTMSRAATNIDDDNDVRDSGWRGSSSEGAAAVGYSGG